MFKLNDFFVKNCTLNHEKMHVYVFTIVRHGFKLTLVAWELTYTHCI